MIQVQDQSSSYPRSLDPQTLDLKFLIPQNEDTNTLVFKLKIQYC